MIMYISNHGANIEYFSKKFDISSDKILDFSSNVNIFSPNVDFDIIFKSAGVPYSAELKPYQDKVLTQMQFFFDHYKGKVIAITASK